MLRYFLVLFVILSVESIAKPLPEDEVNDALAHAEALYYEARFKESIELLSRIDDLLRSKDGQLKEKINVKLHLALAHIGLNESDEAQSSLREVYALDADYRLDPTQFSPKVLALAEEAKTEANEVRCQKVQDEAHKQLTTQNATGALSLIGSMKPKCAGLERIEPDVAELLYKRGVTLYKSGEFANALQDFRQAVKLSPKHELASQYVELTENKLQVNADWLLLDWRKNFDAHEIVQASADYRRLKSYNDANSNQMVQQMRSEYRKALSQLVESWKRACASSDRESMEMIVRQASEMLPERAIGEDILGQMSTCTSTGCLQMNTQLALTRLKTRVNPEFSSVFQTALGRSPQTIRVKARIDEKGDVTVSDAQGGNPVLHDAIKNAVGRWKFSPIMDQNGPRCVDTEIPMVIRPSQ